MAKYLIENLGEAIHPITVRGETVEIGPGQGLIEALNQGEVKRLEHSVGLRLTLREEVAAEPIKAPPVVKVKAKVARKPKPATVAAPPVAEQPAEEPPAEAPPTTELG